ncbi:M24 family metallopeptidase [Thioclava sp. BHET1]|nr:M24 family metallopeptidase [Thioclava sp. BHET1]
MTLTHDRLARLRARMAETDTDLVAVGPTANMVWLAGLSPHGDERPVMLMVTQDHAGFLMPGLNAEAVRPGTDLPFWCWDDAEGPVEALRKLLAEFGVGAQPSVALDETMRADFALLLLDALPGARRSFLAPTLGHLRARKEAAEIDLLKMNAGIDDRVMTAVFDMLRPGITEAEVAAEVDRLFAAEGASAEFAAICFGGNGAFPHHHSGATKLEPDMAVLADLGGRKQDYFSDMTRVGYFGAMPEGVAEIHAIVDEAGQAALAAAKPGVPARMVDEAARGVITRAGYGAQFLHRTGHGLGIEIHEGPFMTGTSETMLDAGMVFTIEPGIYLPGRFGLRLEEVVVLSDSGATILSELPRAPFVRG